MAYRRTRRRLSSRRRPARVVRRRSVRSVRRTVSRRRAAAQTLRIVLEQPGSSPVARPLSLGEMKAIANAPRRAKF